MRNSKNVIHEEGIPSNRIASPITTGFSPAQGGTLDDFRTDVEDGRPADPLNLTPNDLIGNARKTRTRR
jgi:hypothetical protein